MEITKDVVIKLLNVIDAGLAKGLGERRPGQMCVEAAACYALDLPHGDDPECVSRALRSLKISLNDKNWSSKKARAAGLRRLGIAQLGSLDHLDDIEFAKRVVALVTRTCVPSALRAAASIHKDPVHVQELRAMADKCEREPTQANSIEAKKIAFAAYTAADSEVAAYVADAAANTVTYAAYAAAAAAYAADAGAAVAYAADAVADAADAATARDKSLADFAEGVVQILIEMKAPGVQWLELTES